MQRVVRGCTAMRNHDTLTVKSTAKPHNPRNTSSAKDTVHVLAEASRGRPLNPFEQRLIKVLQDEIFVREEDLSTSQRCQLAYRRLRHLRQAMDLRVTDLMQDLDKLLALHEWVSLVDGTVATLLTIHYNLCIGSILQDGAEPAKLQTMVDELESMDSIGVFLATELGYGNNVQAMETEALYDHQSKQFILNTHSARAQKFMPNTGAEGVAKLAVVMARMKVDKQDCGVFPFIVRVRTDTGICPGITITPLGEKPDYPLDNAITSFQNVRIPFHHWLCGRESQISDDGRFSTVIASPRQRFLKSMDRVQAGKLCLAVASHSGLRAMLQLTLTYAQQRFTFAPGRPDLPILAYRPYQLFLYSGIATSYACAYLLREVRDQYKRRTAGDDITINRWMAIAKVFASSRGLEIGGQCRERLGAQGMFAANRVISYCIHGQGIVTAEGDNSILLSKLAREMLLSIQYAPPQDLSAHPSQPDLASVPSLLELLRRHERLSHQALIGRISQATMASTLFDAWNEHLDETNDFALLHGSRITLEAFINGVQSIGDAQARDVLDSMLRLFALQEVARVSTPLLINGLVDSDFVKHISTEAKGLASRIHQNAALLQSGFSIPNSLLGSPIGTTDYIAAYDYLPAARHTAPALMEG